MVIDISAILVNQESVELADRHQAHGFKEWATRKTTAIANAAKGEKR